MRILFLAAATLAIGATTPAFASSSDAWGDFRADVKAKCVAALPEKLRNEAVFVDEFGTEKYGIALISGRPAKEKVRVTFACVYDKQAKTAQVTGSIGPEFVRVLTEKQRTDFLAKQKKNAASAEAETAE